MSFGEHLGFSPFHCRRDARENITEPETQIDALSQHVSSLGDEGERCQECLQIIDSGGAINASPPHCLAGIKSSGSK